MITKVLQQRKQPNMDDWAEWRIRLFETKHRKIWSTGKGPVIIYSKGARRKKWGGATKLF